MLESLQTIKGLFFILTTAGLLYWLNSNQLNRIFQVHRALEESQRQLTTLMDNLPGMAYRRRNDEHGSMDFVSQGCQELFGYSPTELVQNQGLPYAELIYPDDRLRVREIVNTALAQREAFQLTYRIQSRAAGVKWVLEKGEGVYSPEGKLDYVEGFISEITELKKQEAELLRYNRALQTVSACHAVFMSTRTEAELLKKICEVMVETGGYRMAWIGYHHTEEENLSSVATPVAYAGIECKAFMEARNRLGLVTPEENPTASAIRDGRTRIAEGEDFQAWWALAQEYEVNAAICLPLMDLYEAVGALTLLSPEKEIFDTREVQLLEEMVENLVHAIQALRTMQERDRIEIERQKLEEQFLHAQKMEALGVLAGGVAHDFNNMLFIMFGFGELLLEKVKHDPALQHDVVEIMNAAERARTLTRQLLTFSRKQLARPEVLDLNQLIRELEKMLSRLIGENIQMTMEADPELGKVKADPGQVEQVIMNLVVNARDAMAGGGRLSLKTANFRLDETTARQYFDIQPGSYVMLVISDTGVGMDKETQKRIFEPFYTTKASDKGTGLGLATVYGIIKQNGGFIRVYSELGHGTTFKIFLPQVDEEIEKKVEAKTTVPTIQGTETILLSEDEEGICNLLTLFLQKNGYTVYAYATAEEAIQYSEKDPNPIDLLITDMILPGISGVELAQRLALSRPKMKVIYITGYQDNHFVDLSNEEMKKHVLPKPFMPDELLQKIRQILGKIDTPHAMGIPKINP